jgi:hypothetical protein
MLASTIASGVKITPVNSRAKASGTPFSKPTQCSENRSGQVTFVAQSPKMPLRPSSSTKTRPATTGDTEKGRSISEVSRARPRKWNFVVAQAAATPKTMLSGTTMAATSRVRPMALQVREA